MTPLPARAVGDCDLDDPTCDPPGGEVDQKFVPPRPALEYRLTKRANLWTTAWRSGDDTTNKPWPKETYDPKYVHPDTFQADFFQQCRNETDFDFYANDKGDFAQVGTYRWSVNGAVQFAAGACDLQGLQMPGQGIHEVKLEVFAPGQSTPYLTRTTDVRVRDYLIVLLGDSAASGEGSPDGVRSGDNEWGFWVDRRCHRSAQAAVPRAVQALEDADPHSTVTFLNFACSGATIKLWEEGQGAGILAPYAGIEPPEAAVDGTADDESFYLFSQVGQLSNALHYTDLNTYDPLPARSIDALFTSGGINDVRFAKLAVTCVVLDECHKEFTSLYGTGSNQVSSVFDDLAAAIPDAYVELADDLADHGIEVGETFVIQYPNPLEDDDGSLCESILWDVLPPESVYQLVYNPVVAPLIAFNSLLGPVLEHELGVDFQTVLANALTGDLQWTLDEIQWMSDHGMPGLDDAVREGAAAAGFTFVEGVQEAFAKHGYCADVHWMRRAPEASFRQGPWNIVSKPINLFDPTEDLGLGIHALTKGLMHPTDDGYKGIADVLKPIMKQFANHAPNAKSDSYKVNTAITPVVFETNFFGGVLINDFDPDGDEIRSILQMGPAHGSATLSKDGHLVYIPDPGFAGIDGVYYRATDGDLTSSMVKVTFVVDNPRDPRPSWHWSYPTGEETTTVEIGGVAEFPICSRCGDLLVRAEQQPAFGRVWLDRVDDRWVGRYVQNGVAPEELPFVDTVAVDIGRTVLGAFNPEGHADIPVRIEGALCPVCLDGTVCDAATGTCVPEPCSLTECPAGEVCDVLTETCVPKEPSSCSPFADCPAGEVCDEETGTCVKEPLACGPFAGCPAGEICDEETGTCVKEPSFCSLADCPLGTTCDEATETCVPSASACREECPLGTICDPLTATCIDG